MANTHGDAAPDYFVPAPAQWPMVGMIAMAFTGIGAGLVVNHNSTGFIPLAIGLATLVYMMIGWFSMVARESEHGSYNHKVDASFRWGMGWFINHLDQHSLRPPAVEFAVENLFPRAEVQLAFRDRHNNILAPGRSAEQTELEKGG